MTNQFYDAFIAKRYGEIFFDELMETSGINSLFLHPQYKISEEIRMRHQTKKRPIDLDLWKQLKKEAAMKFCRDKPSAYVSAWIRKEYEKRGGKYEQ